MMNLISFTRGLKVHQLFCKSKDFELGTSILRSLANQAVRPNDQRNSGSNHKQTNERSDYEKGFINEGQTSLNSTDEQYENAGYYDKSNYRNQRYQSNARKQYQHKSQQLNEQQSNTRKQYHPKSQQFNEQQPNARKQYQHKSQHLNEQQSNERTNFNKYRNQQQQNRPVQSKATKHKHEPMPKEPSFGRLGGKSDDRKIEGLESEFLDDDPDHLERMEVVTTKKPRNYYLFEIKDAIYKDKKLGVHRALELYREMILDRKKINVDFYKMLIKGCSLVGYVDKAFELYADYLGLRLPIIHWPIVTSMFNCCANSPDKELGLKMAKQLYDELKLSGYAFNLLNYNCLIKTFGLLGDLETAFAFLDMIIENRFHPNLHTFNNLLMATCSNQTEGLGIATNIVQAMRFLHIQPDIYTYNLLYRITRDCHFGTKEQLNDQIKHFKFSDSITSEFLRKVLFRQRMQLKNNYARLLEHQQKTKQLAPSNTSLVVEQQPSELMCLNFLGTSVESIQHQLKIVEIDYKSLSKPENRLKLIGGQDFLFRYMYKDKVRPDIRTISLLTALIPNNEQEETKLIRYAEQLRIKLDTDFYNMLIRKANLREEIDVAKKYLGMMSAKRLAPNIQTYGVMSIGCRNSTDIENFLNDMDAFGVRPNVVIMNMLIKHSIERLNFNKLSHLIKRLVKYGIKPTKELNELFALADELGVSLMSRDLKSKDKSERLNVTFLKFKKELQNYLAEYPTLDNEDPLEQYKTKEIPRNEEFHKFKVQMTKLLKEKQRYMNELQESGECDDETVSNN